MSMSAQITGSDTFTLDAAGNRDAITVPASFTACHRITIWETEGTSEYDLGIAATGAKVTFPRGYVKVFQRSLQQNPFQPSEILGYGSVPSGTITFNILGEEDVL